MPGDDLSSIPDLQDKHRRALAELKITTFRGLVQADRRDIQRGMRNLRPRPTLEQIARWQDQARSRLIEATTDPSDWHPAASFAVVFAQRQAEGGGWERRLEVERTEVEPEQEGRIWPGWDCHETCAWMREQLGLPASAPPGPEGATPQDAGPVAAGAGEVTTTPVRAARAGRRARLRIGKVTVFDPAVPAGAVAGEVAAAAAPAQATGPLRVEISVSGARRDQEIHAVARVVRKRDFGWNPQDPVVIRGAGAASFDLSGLPAGHHEVELIAWAPDGTSEPAVVRLPELTVPPSPP
jgi:hypothetical protein